MKIINQTIGIALMTICFVLPASADILTIEVRNIKSNEGMIGCGLHSDPVGFPLETSKAVQQWIPANRSGVSCDIKNVQPGTYAVAVSHDLNGNKITDTNFLGIPTEDWGVSGGKRPTFRAPTFDEAKFEFTTPLTISVTID